MGVVHYCIGQPMGSLDSFTRAIRLDPSVAEPWFNVFLLAGLARRYFPWSFLGCSCVFGAVSKKKPKLLTYKQRKVLRRPSTR